MRKFNSVAVAGTFDHLHLGHQKLLEAAAQSGRQVFVGLCQKQMLKDKVYPELIENYRLRQKTVSNFLADKPAQIFPLSDVYGPAPTSRTLDAIVCTNQTKSNVDKINALRQFNQLKPLTPLIVDLINSSDNHILSSTRIRAGEVNRSGFAFRQIFPQKLILPAESRRYFQQPFAKVVTKVKHQPRFMTISVGDIATMALLKQNIKLNLAIVDLKTKRQRLFDNLESLGLRPGLTATNPPGTITQDLVKKLLACFHQQQTTLLINGEEDLTVLPAILLSPLKTTIFYGQPDMGMVKIFVTESTKQKALDLLKKFTAPRLNPTLV